MNKYNACLWKWKLGKQIRKDINKLFFLKKKKKQIHFIFLLSLIRGFWLLCGTWRVLSIFLALFLGLWGSFVPFIARKSSSFSFLDKATYIFGHSITSALTFWATETETETTVLLVPAAPAATAPARVSCSDRTGVVVAALSALVIDPFVVFSSFRIFLSNFSDEWGDLLPTADLETPRLLSPAAFRDGDPFAAAGRSSIFLIMVNVDRILLTLSQAHNKILGQHQKNKKRPEINI